ncbi:MAG TPA: NADH:ubiquinone oxidoreductase [Thermoanaerobaculia bacterium]|nr:NADH:ubiquinone oxidoreductase [Thermoanaerobaculia bacterium]
MAAATRPRMGIFGLTGCAGDQLALLDCEDELLEIVERVDVRDFLMASSANDDTGPLDLALVEGAVASRRDEQALRRIRKRSRLVVALGTCAVWGGVAAMDRFADRGLLLREIYGEAGAGYDSLPVRALHEVVAVDCALPGCPVEKHELLSALASFLRGDPPLVPQYPVCTECRMRETVCLLLRDGAVCCGPLTAAGCRARCPALGVPCAGCRGPSRDANYPAALALFEARGIPRAELERKLRTFAPAASLAAAPSALGDGGAA